MLRGERVQCCVERIQDSMEDEQTLRCPKTVRCPQAPRFYGRNGKLNALGRERLLSRAGRLVRTKFMADPAVSCCDVSLRGVCYHDRSEEVTCMFDVTVRWPLRGILATLSFDVCVYVPVPRRVLGLVQ